MSDADHLANRIFYALTLVDRPGTTLAVDIAWIEDGAAQSAIVRLADQRDPRVPRRVWFNAHKLLYEALNRRRTARIFELIREHVGRHPKTCSVHDGWGSDCSCGLTFRPPVRGNS